MLIFPNNLVPYLDWSLGTSNLWEYHYSFSNKKRDVMAREDHFESGFARGEGGEDGLDAFLSLLVVGEGQRVVQGQEMRVAHDEIACDANGYIERIDIDDVAAMGHPVAGRIERDH